MARSDTGTVADTMESLQLAEKDDQDQKVEELCENKKEVFENPLVVERICAFTSSRDLLKFRLVNYIFHHEATTELQKFHKHIVLTCDTSFQELFDCIVKSETLEISPFPFTCFEVNLNVSLETLEYFGKVVGAKINRYCFKITASGLLEPEIAAQMGVKVAVLLSYSPQLIELQLESDQEVYLSDQNSAKVPGFFPHLQVIGMGGKESRRIGLPDDGHPLLDLMISRAGRLKKFKLPAHLPTLSSRILHLFVEKEAEKLPAFTLDGSMPLDIRSTELVKDLLQLDLTFTNIVILMRDLWMHPDQLQNMLQSISSWLKTQANHLTDLGINICPFTTHEQHRRTFQIPSLSALMNLTINFPKLTGSGLCPRALLSLEPNPFPALQKLSLSCHRDDYRVFTNCVMPSVQELHLRNQEIAFFYPTWHRNLPNLVTLRLEVESGLEHVFRVALTYILTHLTNLVNLDLELTLDETKSPISYWDILTGGASRSVCNFLLSRQELSSKAPKAEEAVDGIYRVPSLRNMKALKTLRFLPKLDSSLEALWYMTRSGLLVPLDKLVMSKMSNTKNLKIRNFEMEAFYGEELTRVHKEVVLW